MNRKTNSFKVDKNRGPVSEKLMLADPPMQLVSVNFEFLFLTFFAESSFQFGVSAEAHAFLQVSD